ncbi:MAG: triose-phosphate isomerase [Alphaproteobacteria bacterium]|nr:triose-phosphate isomerase [Alphaproteobacteria bacterium]
MKKLIVANWKMNGSVQLAKELVRDIINGLSVLPDVLGKCEFIICPANLYMYIVRHSSATTPYITLGAQDCAAEENGAHTGDTSASMLKDSACRYVIVGHSERRIDRGETSAVIKAKAQAAHNSGMKIILCVGETLHDRQSGHAENIVRTQLLESVPETANVKNTVIAYEPVWSIGSGLVPELAEIRGMHAMIAQELEKKGWPAAEIRVLYGGSVKADNAKPILNMHEVHGALIGGASMDAAAFIAIAQTVETV